MNCVSSAALHTALSLLQRLNSAGLAMLNAGLRQHYMRGAKHKLQIGVNTQKRLAHPMPNNCVQCPSNVGAVNQL
jgi:hypothetical protein